MKTPTTFGLRHIVLAVAALTCSATATVALAGTSSWFSGERVQGNGSIKKQSRDTGHFNGVSMALPGNVELHIGNTEGISIETDDNLLPLIETKVEQGVLKIRPTKKNMNIEPRTLKIVVNAKEIERLSLGGSGSIDADALRAAKLHFDLGGTGSINVKGTDANSVSVTVGGSGNFKTAGGNTGKLSVSIGGSGDVEAGALKADDVSVSIGGSGHAVVWAVSGLSASIAGSGEVSYYGDPKASKSVVGSGGLQRLGAAPR